jgi:hypothetical protein
MRPSDEVPERAPRHRAGANDRHGKAKMLLQVIAGDADDGGAGHVGDESHCTPAAGIIGKRVHHVGQPGGIDPRLARHGVGIEIDPRYLPMLQHPLPDVDMPKRIGIAEDEVTADE